MSVYVASVSGECTCQWINYSDHGGWYLKTRNNRCPLHGYTAEQED